MGLEFKVGVRMDESENIVDELIEEIRVLRYRVADFDRCEAARDRIQESLIATEKAQRRFSDQLAALVEITNELSTVKTVDELCLRAVEQGRLRLGFDRLGIWFCTEEPGVIVGSYGVDVHGNICDERGKRTRVDRDTPDGRVLLSNEPLTLTGEAPIVNERGQTVGRGEQAFAAIWDGQRVIGHVSMDNRPTKQPITQHQCELLRLFGAALGYLCTRKRAQEERERLIGELQEALTKIKALRGLLPICANCKKIRDDQGYWNRIETYIQEHSEAEFSHGLCPECAKLLYPDLVRDDT